MNDNEKEKVHTEKVIRGRLLPSEVRILKKAFDAGELQEFGITEFAVEDYDQETVPESKNSQPENPGNSSPPQP